MRIPMIVLMFCATIIGHADDARFIQLYDSGKFKEAASELESVSFKNPLVASRVGAMYYSGLGVMTDKERGKRYLEKAMLANNARAAINLAKIFYRSEHNLPKASWCLLKAEMIHDAQVAAEVSTLKKLMGEDFQLGVVSYVEQLQGQLSNTEQDNEKLAKKLRDSKASHIVEVNKMKSKIGNLEKKLDDLNASHTGEMRKAKSEIDDLQKKAKSDIGNLEKKLADSNASHTGEMRKAKSEIDNLQKKAKSDIGNLEKKLADTNKGHKAEISKMMKDFEKKLADTNAKWTLERLVAENQVAAAKAIINSSRIETTGGKLDVEQIPRDKIYDRYNRLVGKYNVLVRRYNALLESANELLDIKK